MNLQITLEFDVTIYGSVLAATKPTLYDPGEPTTVEDFEVYLDVSNGKSIDITKALTEEQTETAKQELIDEYYTNKQTAKCDIAYDAWKERDI